MSKISLLILFLILLRTSYAQETAVKAFMSDSSMTHASVSVCIRDGDTGESILDIEKGTSLAPASVMKLITSGVALELLGPEHKFRTALVYSGTLNKRTGRLKGDVIIVGGGDPALGSAYFEDNCKDFPDTWVKKIKELGIRKIEGRIITDDSYFDYLPVPAKWQWEDLGNYYGAGVYGLNIFDNTTGIHFRTSSEGFPAIITASDPPGYKTSFVNLLTASGNADEGYILSAPYSDHGIITGTIPVNQDDFVLKGSMADPPLMAAKLITDRLNSAGIAVKGEPATFRSEGRKSSENVTLISEIYSPPLARIIEVLNHESVNLFAETLLKELGKRMKNSGSTASGLEVVYDYLHNANIITDGIYIEDGSGLSPRDALNSETLVNFLMYMKYNGKYFTEYFASLPEGGKEGTLAAWFRDPAFESKLKAKSGSMQRVRCYAGYFTTNSGKNMIFSILANNFCGPSTTIIPLIEGLLREIILYK